MRFMIILKFWGDRHGKLKDPFGHHWSVGTHIRDVSLEEMMQAMRSMGGAPEREQQ